MLLHGLISRMDFDIVQRIVEPTSEDLKDPFELQEDALIRTLANVESTAPVEHPVRDIISMTLPICLVPEGQERNPNKVSCAIEWSRCPVFCCGSG